MTRRSEIERILKERNIKVLLHFTQLKNLPSILTSGLKPRNAIDKDALFNDEHRLDNHLDTVSLSIHHPNDPMFFKYRTQLRAEDPNSDWCVLGIHSSILLDYDALFCNRNAASATISCLDEEELRKPESLEGMFEEIVGHESREEQCLKPNDPTDVQAEILLKGTIPPELIVGIVFTSRQAKKDHNDIIGERFTKIHPERVTYLSRRDIQRRYR